MSVNGKSTARRGSWTIASCAVPRCAWPLAVMPHGLALVATYYLEGAHASKPRNFYAQEAAHVSNQARRPFNSWIMSYYHWP